MTTYRPTTLKDYNRLERQLVKTVSFVVSYPNKFTSRYSPKRQQHHPGGSPNRVLRSPHDLWQVLSWHWPSHSASKSWSNLLYLQPVTLSYLPDHRLKCSGSLIQPQTCIWFQYNMKSNGEFKSDTLQEIVFYKSSVGLYSSTVKLQIQQKTIDLLIRSNDISE